MRVAVVVCLGLVLAGCIVQRANIAHEAQQQMVGLPQEQVLACMGAPVARNLVGATEVWTYPSGNGRVTSVTNSSASAVGASGTAYNGSIYYPNYSGNSSTVGVARAEGSTVGITTRRYCIVNVVMTNGFVSRVNYSGPTGGLISQDEQCAFAVQNCVGLGATPQPSFVAAAPQQSISERTKDWAAQCREFYKDPRLDPVRGIISLEQAPTLTMQSNRDYVSDGQLDALDAYKEVNEKCRSSMAAVNPAAWKLMTQIQPSPYENLMLLYQKKITIGEFNIRKQQILDKFAAAAAGGAK